jgi:cytochrome c peroxidase
MFTAMRLRTGAAAFGTAAAAAAGFYAVGGIVPSTPPAAYSKAAAPDYQKVAKQIDQVIEDNNAGPLLVRLAWHAAGTFDKGDFLTFPSGGSDGATMRHAAESAHGGNAGLWIARDLLEPVKKNNPNITYADLWSLAGAVAIDTMGGPKVEWRPGRPDYGPEHCTPDGRLPDGGLGSDHLRDVFYRMGFNDQEIVALSGAHTLGECHTDRSGFWGPWAHNPNGFDNEYFTLMLGVEWTPKKWEGPFQYEDPTGKLMMLPTDLALRDDPAFRPHVEVYAKDMDKFFGDFSSAFQKLQENGCETLGDPVKWDLNK